MKRNLMGFVDLKDELERKKKELEAAQRSIELDLALRKIPSLIQECHFY